MLSLLAQAGLAVILNTTTYKEAWSAFGCSAHTAEQQFVLDNSYRHFPMLTTTGVTRKGLKNLFQRSGCCGKETCDIVVPSCATTECPMLAGLQPGVIFGNFNAQGTPRLSEGDSALDDIVIEDNVTPWVAFWKNEDTVQSLLININYRIPGTNAHDWPDFSSPTYENPYFGQGTTQPLSLIKSMTMNYDTYPTLSVSNKYFAKTIPEGGMPFVEWRKKQFPPLTTPLFKSTHNKTFDEIMIEDPPPQVTIYDMSFFVKYNTAPCKVGRWVDDFYVFTEVNTTVDMYKKYYEWENKYTDAMYGGPNPVLQYPQDYVEFGGRLYVINRLVYHAAKCPDPPSPPPPTSEVVTLDSVVEGLTAPGGKFEADPSNPSSLYFQLRAIPFHTTPDKERWLYVVNIPDDLSKLNADKFEVSYYFDMKTGVGRFEYANPDNYRFTQNKADVCAIFKHQLEIVSSGSMIVDDILDSGKGFVVMNRETVGMPRTYMDVYDLRNASDIKMHAVVYAVGQHLVNWPTGWIQDADFTQALQDATQAYVSNPTSETAAALVQPTNFPSYAGQFFGRTLPTWIAFSHSTNPDAMQAWTQYWAHHGENGLLPSVYEATYSSLDAMRSAFLSVPKPELIFDITSNPLKGKKVVWVSPPAMTENATPEQWVVGENFIPDILPSVTTNQPQKLIRHRNVINGSLSSDLPLNYPSSIFSVWYGYAGNITAGSQFLTQVANLTMDFLVEKAGFDTDHSDKYIFDYYVPGALRVIAQFDRKKSAWKSAYVWDMPPDTRSMFPGYTPPSNPLVLDVLPNSVNKEIYVGTFDKDAPDSVLVDSLKRVAPHLFA